MMFVFLGLIGVMLLLDVKRWSILVYAKIVIFTLSAAGELSFLSLNWPRCRCRIRTHPSLAPGMIALGVSAAGGVGPVVSEPSKVHGSEKAWLIIRFILTSAASCSTFASNASDWQRNARRPNDPILGQLIGFPLSNFIVQSIGMLIASTSAGVYGEVICTPHLLLYAHRNADIVDRHREPCRLPSTIARGRFHSGTTSWGFLHRRRIRVLALVLMRHRKRVLLGQRLG